MAKDDEQVFTEGDAGAHDATSEIPAGVKWQPGAGDNEPKKPIKTPPAPPAGHGKGGK